MLLAFAILIAAMNFSQSAMLFPTHAVPPAGVLPAGAQRLDLVTPDGEKLHGVHIPPRKKGQRSGTLLLGFGGNAWNGQDVAEYLAELYPDADVVAYHYRGYHPSTGSPSAQALKDDATLVFDQANALVMTERVIAVGFSIGSGVAANLSRKRKLDGLILVTPFDSMKKVAADMFPWLPVGMFFQHEFAAAEDLRAGSLPVAIVAGERDELVRPARTEALRGKVPNLIFDRTIAGAGHNDIYQRGDFQDAMRNALEAMIQGNK